VGSVDEEIWALRLCMAETQFQLTRFATSFVEDAKLVEDKDKNPKKWTYRFSVAFSYRVERKALLTEAYIFCRRALEIVERDKEIVPYVGAILLKSAEYGDGKASASKPTPTPEMTKEEL